MRVEGKLLKNCYRRNCMFFCKFDAKIELLKKDVFLNSMMESGSTDFDVFLRMVSIEVVQWRTHLNPWVLQGRCRHLASSIPP